MKRFFNIIPEAGTCRILLYGNIGLPFGCDPGDIARELYEAEAKYDKIEVRINSLGGDVYAGIALFNALHNSKPDISIYIDGVAASMAAVIAMCGKPVYMSKHARMMLHGVSGSCDGNKQMFERCIAEIEAIENTLCAMCAQRLKKSEADVRAEYFDGKDHWFTADEALSLGFIDGVYDAESIPEVTKEPDDQAHQGDTSVTNSKKMFLRLKQLPRFAGCKSEGDVLDHIKEMEEELNAYKSIEKENAEKEIIDMVDRAANEGRIPYPQKETYLAIMRADRANGEKLLASLPRKRRVMDEIQQANSPADRNRWTLTDYRKFAPRDLQRDPALYQRLLTEEQTKQR